jgi:hypothetical protein
MKLEEYQAEHVRLHHALDELIACYIGEAKYSERRSSIHDEIYELMKWSHRMTKLPLPAVMDVVRQLVETTLIAQNDDPELLEWLNNAAQRGGGFVQSFADAALRADHENYPLIRAQLLVMRKNYPAYEPSDAVKQEIKDRARA